jgi:hypothetical protein
VRGWRDRRAPVAQKGQAALFESRSGTFRDLDETQFRRLRNQFSNAFKHATTHKGKERDDRKLLGRFNDLQNDHTLFVGWYDYANAAKRLPLEAQIFQVWYFSLYAEKLGGKCRQDALREDFSKFAKAFTEKAEASITARNRRASERHRSNE